MAKVALGVLRVAVIKPREGKARVSAIDANLFDGVELKKTKKERAADVGEILDKIIDRGASATSSLLKSLDLEA